MVYLKNNELFINHAPGWFTQPFWDRQRVSVGGGTVFSCFFLSSVQVQYSGHCQQCAYIWPTLLRHQLQDSIICEKQRSTDTEMGTKRLDVDMRWVTFLGQQPQNYQKIPEVVASSSELEFLRWISLLPDSAGSFFPLRHPKKKRAIISGFYLFWLAKPLCWHRSARSAMSCVAKNLLRRPCL